MAHLFHHIETLWDYMQLNQPLVQADCIFVLGSNDVRVAEYAAQLYHQKLAPKIIFSGGRGRFTQDLPTSEAELFADVANAMGVPRYDMILETRSTNSGENIQFTANCLAEQNIQFNSFILLQKPYMERRALATFVKQWPHSYHHVCVHSTRQNIYDFCNEELELPDVIEALVGDFERIKNYPAQGFQIAQEIPQHVEHAYQAMRLQYPFDTRQDK